MGIIQRSNPALVNDPTYLEPRVTAAEVRVNSLEKDKELVRPVIDFDINNSRAIRASSFLDIPTYVAINDEMLHPSVYYHPDGWNGYRFWMAFTPYTNSDYQYENPSIVASNDGINWIVPPGLTNPIDAQPAPGYNSDTHLCMSPDDTTMYLIYRETGTGNGNDTIYSRASTDGITWGVEKTLLTTGTTVQRDVSPAVIWDGGQYVMWTVDIVPTPNVLMKRTSASLTGLFSNPVVCNFALPASMTGDELWHIDVKKIGHHYYMLTNTVNNELILGKSLDGVNWTVQNKKLLGKKTTGWDRTLYRSCFLPKFSGKGNVWSMWYSAGGGTDGWRTAYTEITFDLDKATRDKDTNRNIETVFIKNKIPPYVAGDRFDRPDTASGLGITFTGETWTLFAGSGVFGISSGTAYAVSATNTRAYFDSLTSNKEVSVDIPLTGSQFWLIFRMSNETNYYRYGIPGAGASVELQKIEAGALTKISTVTNAMVDTGDVLKVSCVGDQISLYINDSLIEIVTSAFNSTATKVGLNTNNTTTRFDNLIVKQA